MQLETSEVSRIIEMAWEDRTPFEAIENSFDLNESAVIYPDAPRVKAAFIPPLAQACHQP